MHVTRHAQVKCRLGTDEQNGYDKLCNFVRIVSSGGCVKRFVIHARECILSKSFTPRDNRRIPPLRPRWAHLLQRDFPDLIFDINGGIKTLDMALAHLGPLDCSTSPRGHGHGGCGGDDEDAGPRSSHQYGSYHGLNIENDSENHFSAVGACTRVTQHALASHARPIRRPCCRRSAAARAYSLPAHIPPAVWGKETCADMGILPLA
jgi:hypothetical protein